MCLYVGNKIALVAKKDIVVYKELIHHKGVYFTPCQGTKVRLNETMVPEEVSQLHKEYYNKYSIEGGAIHAYLKTNKPCFKAIIKAGTTYYAQDDLTEIAAKELYITDEQVSGNLVSPDTEEICRDYLEAILSNPEYTGNNGVCVGYYRLSDGAYANPLSEFDKSKAIGIVAYINKDGNPVTMVLGSKQLPWLTKWDMKNEVCSDIKSDDITEDLDGKKHTEDIRKGKGYDPEKFCAVEYCVTYKTEGTKEGDWYLGAIGEIVRIAQNMGIIDAAMGYTGIGEPLEFDWMWSSSESTWNGTSCAWYCDLNLGSCSNDYDYRNGKHEVRPLSCFH